MTNYLSAEQAREKFSGAWIGQGAVIGQCVWIGQGAVIGQGAWIEQSAVIEQDAWIEQNAVIGQGAWIGRDAVIEQNAVIGQDAWIGRDAVIERGAVIQQDAWIERCAAIGRHREGVTRTLVINGLGTTRQLTAHDSDDGLVIVIGCFNDYRGGTVEEVRQAISDKYPAQHPYFIALDLVVAWYSNIQVEGDKI